MATKVVGGGTAEFSNGCLYVNKFGIPVCKEKDQCWKISHALMSGTYSHVGERRFEIAPGKTHPNIPFFKAPVSQKDNMQYESIIEDVQKHKVTVSDIQSGADKRMATSVIQNEKKSSAADHKAKCSGGKTHNVKKSGRSCNESLPGQKKKRSKPVNHQDETCIRTKLLEKMKSDLLREANESRLSRTNTDKELQSYRNTPPTCSSTEGSIKLPYITQSTLQLKQGSSKSFLSSTCSCSLNESTATADDCEAESSESETLSQNENLPLQDGPTGEYEAVKAVADEMQETAEQVQQTEESQQTALDIQKNQDECLRFMQDLADKQKSVREVIAADGDIDHKAMLDECGWRAEIPGNPFNVKRFPHRVPYYVTMPAQLCSKRFPEHHYKFFNPFFLNTIPHSRYSYTINPNFVSEHLEGMPSLRPKSHFR